MSSNNVVGKCVRCHALRTRLVGRWCWKCYRNMRGEGNYEQAIDCPERRARIEHYRLRAEQGLPLFG